MTRERLIWEIQHLVLGGYLDFAWFGGELWWRRLLLSPDFPGAEGDYH